MEINPQTINPDYQVSSLDPCPSITRPQYYQTVYSCSGFPIEPYQQLYPFQSGTFLVFEPTTLYEIEIITGTEYAYFERVEHIDTLGNFYPYETFGNLLSGLTGAELSGTGNYIGYEGLGTFERENSTVYRIHYDNYSQAQATVIIRIKYLNTGLFTDWHTLIVNPDLRFVNQQNEADTLLHYYSKDVTPRFINANSPCAHPGYGGCPPDNVTFNIEIIEGQQYGSIKNSETNETATSFTGLSYNNLNTTFTYYANGEQPDTTSIVKIRNSSNDAEITPMEFEFTVKRNTIPPPSEGGSIYVKMDKKVVIPGDTVNVQLRWIDAVGDTVEFSQIQRFKVDLAEGSEYGTILDVQTGNTSDTFTEIANEFKVIVNPQIEQQQAKIVLVAEADLIIFTRPVRIYSGTNTTKQLQEHTVDKVDEEGGTNTDVIFIGNHLVGVGEIIINPFIVEIDPPVISAGDTARIIPKYLDENGNFIEYPANQSFELGMLDGCVLGKLSNAGIDTNYFYGVTQPFYFIADSSADSGTVSVRVGVIDMNQQNRSITNNNTPENDYPTEYCFYNIYQTDLYLDVPLPIEQKYEILLGETKYFGVKKKTETGELKIEEIKTDYGNEPKFPADADGWEWQKSDVWPTEPVEKIEGDKVGVYWEKEKPVWNGNIKQNNLKKGILRIIGKYWESGKTFKVKLKTLKLGDKEASINLTVKSPGKLLIKDNNPSYRNSKDIRNNELDIDNYLIENGGKYGIPPQLLKGQLFEEAYHRENESFWPTYRYEPWYDLRSRKGKFKEEYKKQPYWVNESGMGIENGGEPVPIDHQNVKPNLNFSTPTPYPNSPMKIGDYVADNLGEYYRGRHLNRKFSGAPMYGPSKLQEIWNFLVKYYSTLGNGDTELQADYFIRIYLKQTYKDIAQTRKAASYGYFQMLYTTAIMKEPKGPNYPRWPGNYPAPEKINDQDISTPYIMDHLKSNIITILKNTSKTFDKNDWTNGFEQAWFDSYHLYNNRSDYDDNVFIFSKKFLPR